VNRADTVGEPVIYEYLDALWRHRLAVVTVSLLVPAAVLAYSLHQPSRYQATTAVFVSQQSSVAALAGVSSSAGIEDPARFTVTQASLARTGEVVTRTLAAARLDWTQEQFLADSSVTAAPDADMLSFSVKASDPALAEKLVGIYARQFTVLRAELDAAAVTTAKNEVNSSLQRLVKEKRSGTALYRDLLTSYRRLVTLQALQTASAVVAGQPAPATRVAPRPVRNTAVAIAFGIVLALSAGFLLDLLDTRLRSAAAVARALRLPILGRLPSPDKRSRSSRAGGSGGRPPADGAETDAVRALRIELGLAAEQAGAKVLALTGVCGGEGASTTCESVARSFARAGQNVAVVDLGFRETPGEGLFAMQPRRRLADAAFGRLSLDDVTVPIPETETPPMRGGHTVGGLHLLSGDLSSPESRSALEQGLLSPVFDDLKGRFDIVLVDSPGLLSGPDALAISSLADALVLVVRLGALGRRDVRDVREALGKVPTLLLGAVVTRAEADSDRRPPGLVATAAPEKKAISDLSVRVTRSITEPRASDDA
jgi:succinoglycan biosynthesis transport protein ExoP